MTPSSVAQVQIKIGGANCATLMDTNEKDEIVIQFILCFLQKKSEQLEEMKGTNVTYRGPEYKLRVGE